MRSLNDGYEKKYGFHDDVKYLHNTGKGLSEDVINKISQIKNEPQWMTDIRLRALKVFLSKPMPTWGADLSKIDFDNITYYMSPSDAKTNSWDEVPEEIKRTFDDIRYKRNSLTYYGNRMDYEIAKQAIEKCKKIIKEITKINN